ncbi:MAG: 1-deoxy-D-xylulose-5-phosphate reductoisomerase, partial [Gemmatimonadetes bacterium]|nr:1-deoxy-D-xylulose-5-phosphate reductoisomerase [Gemmatimonadota bacterium]
MDTEERGRGEGLRKAAPRPRWLPGPLRFAPVHDAPGVRAGAAGAGPGVKRVVILGATGSVGLSALEIARRHTPRFKVVGLSANSSVAALERLAAEFRPEAVALADPGALDGRTDLRRAGWRAGPEATRALATLAGADIVVNAIVGAAGLRYTIAALEAGKRCALANKESLVAAGELVLDASRRGGGELVPVD